MNGITLALAEALHLRIGTAALSAGLRALHVGPLAFPIREGLAPATRSGIWAIVRPDPDTLPAQNGLETAGEPLFELSVEPAATGGGGEILNVVIAGTPVPLRVRRVSKRGRSSLDRFKAAIGAGQQGP